MVFLKRELSALNPLLQMEPRVQAKEREEERVY